jgi:hypothetical protein
MFKYIKFGLLLATVLFFCVSSSFSQNNTTKLEQWVTDKAGNPARNATILCVNKRNNFTSKSVTDENGRFVLLNFPPGPFRCTLFGEGGRGQDIIVDAEILPNRNYELGFDRWEKGRLVEKDSEISPTTVETVEKSSKVVSEKVKPSSCQVKVVVTDRSGKPISNAKMTVRGTFTSDERIRDSGSIEIIFPCGQYVFGITAPHYKSQTKSAELKDDSLTLAFRLKKKGLFGFFK